MSGSPTTAYASGSSGSTAGTAAERFRLRICPGICAGDLLAFTLDRFGRRRVFGPDEPTLDPHGGIIASVTL